MLTRPPSFDDFRTTFGREIAREDLVLARWKCLSERDRASAIRYLPYQVQFFTERNAPPLNAYTYLVTRWWTLVRDPAVETMALAPPVIAPSVNDDPDAFADATSDGEIFALLDERNDCIDAGGHTYLDKDGVCHCIHCGVIP